MVENLYPSLECGRCDSDVIPTWPETEQGELDDTEVRLECSCLEVKINQGEVTVPSQWRRSSDGEHTRIQR